MAVTSKQGLHVFFILLGAVSVPAPRPEFYEAEPSTAFSFGRFKANFGRTYEDGSEEHKMRENIFNDKVDEVLAHNAKGLTWKLGLNQFSDRTEGEVLQYRGFKRGVRPLSTAALALNGSNASGLLQIDDDGHACAGQAIACTDERTACCNGLICGAEGTCLQVGELPESVDYVSTLKPGSILDQRSCGSCWAMAATFNVEMMAKKVYGLFSKTLSPQSALGCSENKLACGGEGGCDGSIPELAFDYWKGKGAAGGIYTTEQQAYTAKATDGCPLNTASILQVAEGGSASKSGWDTQKVYPPTHGISIGGWVRLKENQADQVMQSLATAGPLSVAVVANGMNGYESGIIRGMANNVVDHAVVLMGYGAESQASSLLQGRSSRSGENMKFWKLRNSWGDHWGEKGYFRVERFHPHAEEPCGIDPDPAKGVGCKDPLTQEYPKSLIVCGTLGLLSDVAYPVQPHVPTELLDSPPPGSSEYVGSEMGPGLMHPHVPAWAIPGLASDGESGVHSAIHSFLEAGSHDNHHHNSRHKSHHTHAHSHSSRGPGGQGE